MLYDLWFIFEEKRIIFQFVFIEIPTYQEVVNRTPKVYPIFAYASQQKNSREGILETNLNWQDDCLLLANFIQHYDEVKELHGVNF